MFSNTNQNVFTLKINFLVDPKGLEINFRKIFVCLLYEAPQTLEALGVMRLFVVGHVRWPGH